MKKSLRISLAGMFLALGLVLPFITGQIPEVGKALLPMHLSVLLCGLVCGSMYGLGIGFITPLLRSLIFTMPPLFPSAIAMAFELSAYGFIIGFLYDKFKGGDLSLYAALIIAMLLGRVVWGLVSVPLYALNSKPFTFPIFFALAFTNALPGIALQLVLIPLIAAVLRRLGYLRY